eukprot:TRINITY_DN12488_c0_g1_i1.p1 TRINITY_DN12488_c0_g1~~TRINITY_DN12488_c0_g1_i1.p1  ORF type:complete len:429 (-),score=57.40 TRINITY_DN12488_c0_g1_i1:110-1252(-)
MARSVTAETVLSLERNEPSRIEQELFEARYDALLAMIEEERLERRRQVSDLQKQLRAGLEIPSLEGDVSGVRKELEALTIKVKSLGGGDELQVQLKQTEELVKATQHHLENRLSSLESSMKAAMEKIATMSPAPVTPSQEAARITKDTFGPVGLPDRSPLLRMTPRRSALLNSGESEKGSSTSLADQGVGEIQSVLAPNAGSKTSPELSASPVLSTRAWHPQTQSQRSVLLQRRASDISPRRASVANSERSPSQGREACNSSPRFCVAGSPRGAGSARVGGPAMSPGRGVGVPTGSVRVVPARSPGAPPPGTGLPISAALSRAVMPNASGAQALGIPQDIPNYQLNVAARQNLRTRAATVAAVEVSRQTLPVAWRPSAAF